MYKASAGVTLPTSIIGSLPRPSWYTVGLGAQNFLEAMMNLRYREQYEDAVSVYLRAQETAGLDIVTDGDAHFDEQISGMSWQSYPLTHMAGFSLEQAIARYRATGPAHAWAANCCARLVHANPSEDPEADRLKGADSARPALQVAGDDPGILAECRSRAGLFRRGHRCHDCVSRACLRAQPEFRAKVVCQRPHPAMSAGQPDAASAPTRTAADQPARPHRHVAFQYRRRHISSAGASNAPTTGSAGILSEGAGRPALAGRRRGLGPDPDLRLFRRARPWADPQHRRGAVLSGGRQSDQSANRRTRPRPCPIGWRIPAV